MEIFSVITMKAKNGKTLYLGANEKTGCGCVWSIDRDKAIWFNTTEQAQQFAKQYFKNFKNYDIIDFEYSIG